MDNLRDHLMYAAVFGWFSFVWFGWAQEAPPAAWRAWLGSGAVLGLITGIVGGYLSYQHWHAASALNSNRNFQWYLVFFVAELSLALVGALGLFYLHKADQVVVWVSLVVAVHFIGLKFVFDDSALFGLAGLMLLVLIFAYPMATHFQVALSAVIGAANGILLLGFAWLGFLRFLM